MNSTLNFESKPLYVSLISVWKVVFVIFWSEYASENQSKSVCGCVQRTTIILTWMQPYCYIKVNFELFILDSVNRFCWPEFACLWSTYTTNFPDGRNYKENPLVYIFHQYAHICIYIFQQVSLEADWE